MNKMEVLLLAAEHDINEVRDASHCKHSHVVSHVTLPLALPLEKVRQRIN
jgi:hypothetical protein